MELPMGNVWEEYLYLSRWGFLTMTFPTLAWLIVGLTLCAFEFILPLKPQLRFTALFPGLLALIIFFFVWRYSFFIDQPQLQILYWMTLSMVAVIWVRPMLFPRKGYREIPTTEAVSLTVFYPGETGRVLYEGVSWPARCELGSGAISPQQTVYVLAQEGNTLIVTPKMDE